MNVLEDYMLLLKKDIYKVHVMSGFKNKYKKCSFQPVKVKKLH